MSRAMDNILKKYRRAGIDSLIPMLQDVQAEQGYLSKDAVAEIGRHLKVPASKIYGVATFYNQFRFEKLGRYHIQICRGTACHVKGSATLQKVLEQQLGVKAGQTTRDGLFSLEVVACIGACGLAPVISVNGEFHASVKQEEVGKILDVYRRRAESEGGV